MKNIKKFVAIFCCMLLLFSFAACNEKAEFSFATDLQDGKVVSEQSLTFSASATCGDSVCEMEVSCDGVLLTRSKNGTYTAILADGVNEIVLLAKSGKNRQQRTYNVTYRHELEIQTDIETAPIQDDFLTFSASATFNGEPCAISVTQNGKTLAETGNVYKAELVNGKNIFVLFARSGEDSVQRQYTIDYGGFTIQTTLEEGLVSSPELSFRASASYGKELCKLNVYIGETLIEADGISYRYTLPHEGNYEVLMTAEKDGMTKTLRKEIRYSESNPSFSILNIEDDKEYKGNIFSFEVAVDDGLGNKAEDSCLSFSMDKNAEDGKEDFVTLTVGKDLKLVWSDTMKTSYRIDFKQNAFAGCEDTPFFFRLTISLNEKVVSETFRMTYVGPDPDGKIGEVVFAMEGFSIGCGYFVEPMMLSVYENQPFAATLKNLLEEKGWECNNTGSVESAFYLAGVTGLDLTGNKIPESLKNVMASRGISIQYDSMPYDGNPVRLGEFDYCQGSGWVYSVDGTFPNYGFSDYFPQDGDVVRVMFTLWYGSDVGDRGSVGAGGSSFLDDDPDYAPILTMLADIAKNNFYGKERTVYDVVLKEITTWNLSQKVMDEQIEKLKTEYCGGQV